MTEIPRAGRHVVITGGAGYVGSVLTGALLARGDHVTVIDNLSVGDNGIANYLAHPRFQLIKADICEPDLLVGSLRLLAENGGPQIAALIHLAAVVGYPACIAAGPESVWEVNVGGLRRMSEQAVRLGVERFIFASTYSVYGRADNGPVDEDSDLHPQSLYAESKLAGEAALKESLRNTACAPLIFRFSTIFGVSPRMRFDLLVNQFVMEAWTKKRLCLFQPGQSRSFIHVQDVAAGVILGLDAPLERIKGKTFNLGHESGNCTKREVASVICRALPETLIEHRDVMMDGDMRDVRVSFESVRNALGFSPEWTLEAGIEEIVELLRSGVIEDSTDPRYRNAEPVLRD
jgi:nucleoside-diphosphate-sugar epimerase